MMITRHFRGLGVCTYLYLREFFHRRDFVQYIKLEPLLTSDVAFHFLF